MLPQIDSGIAYLLWCTCLLGFCGEPAAIQALLQQAQQLDYAEVTNDPQTRAIRYRFDV